MSKLFCEYHQMRLLAACQMFNAESLQAYWIRWVKLTVYFLNFTSEVFKCLIDFDIWLIIHNKIKFNCCISTLIAQKYLRRCYYIIRLRNTKMTHVEYWCKRSVICKVHHSSEQAHQNQTKTVSLVSREYSIEFTIDSHYGKRRVLTVRFSNFSSFGWTSWSANSISLKNRYLIRLVHRSLSHKQQLFQSSSTNIHIVYLLFLCVIVIWSYRILLVFIKSLFMSVNFVRSYSYWAHVLHYLSKVELELISIVDQQNPVGHQKMSFLTLRKCHYEAIKGIAKIIFFLLKKCWVQCSALTLLVLFVYGVYGGLLAMASGIVGTGAVVYKIGKLFWLFINPLKWLFHALGIADWFLYHPEDPPDSRINVASPSILRLPYESAFVKTADGVTINLVLVKQDSPDKFSTAPTFVYLHGNAGNIGHRLQNVSELYHYLGCNVLLVEYRGYGLSKGTSHI